MPLCQYNLQLIEDRDAELERYDGAFANLKNALRDRDAEVSDLKVSIDELEAQVRAEQQRAAQVEGYCKDKLTEAKERLEGLRLQVRVWSLLCLSAEADRKHGQNTRENAAGRGPAIEQAAMRLGRVCVCPFAFLLSVSLRVLSRPVFFPALPFASCSSRPLMPRPLP